MDPTFPYAGNVRIPPAQFHLRTRIEKSTRDFTNAKQFEHWQTDTPSLTNNKPKIVDSKKISNIPYYDMEPTNTRGDARDYKQSQPYVAGGPDLEYNPYFDRYDPVRDPRNAVRELRSAVYEDRGGNRSEKESQKFLRRQFEHRWNAEELIDDDKMDTFLRYEIATAEKQSNQIELQ